MEGDCNVYAHSSLWMRPTRPDRYNAKMVYSMIQNDIFVLHKRFTDISLAFSVQAEVKGVLHLLPKISMFCALSQNNQQLFEK